MISKGYQAFFVLVTLPQTLSNENSKKIVYNLVKLNYSINMVNKSHKNCSISSRKAKLEKSSDAKL
jgi:hypothetical protein